MVKTRQAGTGLVIPLALAALSLIVYAQVVTFDFVDYDDNVYVTENPWVLRGLTWEGIKWAFTTSQQSNWHPLIYLSLMTDITLAGEHPGFMHGVNLALHICNVLLLSAALNALTGKKWRSAFVAGLFAVHPLQVESVAWIAERKDVLSAVFWMLTLIAYVRYTREPNRRSYALLLAIFALGLMAKSMLVTLPVILLLLDYWPLGRLQLSRGRPPARQLEEGRDGARPLLEKAPMFAMSAAAAGLTLWAHTTGGSIRGLESYPLGIRLANTPVSYVAHLGKAFWPSDLAVFYPHPGNTLPEWQVAGSALLLASVTMLAIVFRKRCPYALVGWLWYLIALLPVIGLVQTGDQARCDHHTYTPLIGLFIAVTWLAGDLIGKMGAGRVAPRYVAAGAAVVVLIGCTAAARVQTSYWRESATLWRRALSCTRNNYIAHDGLGGALESAGKHEEAVAHFRQALRILPTFAGARVNLGSCLAEMGKLDQAAAEFRAALRSNPRSDEALYNLGYVFVQRGKLPDAKKLFARAVSVNPDNAAALIGLGNIMTLEHRTELARTYYRQALRIEPDSGEAHFGMAVALGSQGLFAEAVPHYRASLRRRFRVYESANNLAWILATSPDERLRDPAEAIRVAKIALRHAKAKKSSALDTLAAAYAAAGDFDKAVQTSRAAVDTARKMGQRSLMQEHEMRLRLYQAHKPYVQKP